MMTTHAPGMRLCISLWLLVTLVRTMKIYPCTSLVHTADLDTKQAFQTSLINQWPAGLYEIGL